MKTIYFRNKVQAALFQVELSSQISDGMWENTRPHDHYKPWCDAEVKVNSAGIVGRNFFAQKDNYNFTSTELLDCVGDRMLNIANMAENNISFEIIEEFNEYSIEDFKRKDNYWVIKAAKFVSYFGNDENFTKLNVSKQGSYNMKKLRKELNDMKAIIKIHLTYKP